MEEEIVKLEEKGNSKYLNLLSEYKKYQQVTAAEIEVNRRIASQALEDKENFIKKVEELRGILRAPRLYRQYVEMME